jgi:hypothetical protein
MSTMTANAFKTEADRIAAMVIAIRTALGVNYTDTNTCAKGAANALTAILALNDAEQLNALLPSAQRFKEGMLAGGFYYGGLQEFLDALDRHVGGINAFCTTNAVYVHYLLRDVRPQILPQVVFPPVTDFGSIALTGSGAGAFTAQDVVDTTLYGDGLIELVTEHLIGGANITGTIYGYKANGDAVQADYTIASGTASGVTVAIAGTNRFASINKTLTDAAISGGTNLDAFRIQTKLDRSPTGLA